MKLRYLVAALALLTAPADAQTTYQFPNSPWQAFAPKIVQCGELRGANFNITTDQAIPISVPNGYTIDKISISGPSVSMTTAAGGFYTGAGKTGVTVVAAGQTYSTLTNNTANTAGNYMTATIAATTVAFSGYASPNQVKTLYFSLTTPQGAAATANIRVSCNILY